MGFGSFVFWITCIDVGRQLVLKVRIFWDTIVGNVDVMFVLILSFLNYLRWGCG